MCVRESICASLKNIIKALCVEVLCILYIYMLYTCVSELT